LTPHSLPQTLHDLADKPLPTSELFQSVLHDTDVVDESELAQWDRIPPYHIADQQFSALYISNLVDVMHGRRMREHQRAVENHRRETRRSEPIDVHALRKTLSSLLRVEMNIWEESKRWIEENNHIEHTEVCYIMANHYLQWSARRARSLHEEQTVLGQGVEAYINFINSSM
ncbi:hypothetical protein HWV62_2603, partial [Athelia sp. TMB]